MTQLDWLAIVIYLGAVVAFGIWVGRKDQDMEDYFLGGRRIPWWAALLSMVATEISAATFLGAPEQGYIRDLTYLQFGIGSILARFALAFLFMGIFYKLRVITVYGFLSQRFGIPTKNCAAGAYLLGRLFAGGSRLFIASLAVKVVTGMDFSLSILVLGLIAIVYTLFGGIKAVIWTDVVQAVVLIGAAIISVFWLLGDIPLSIPQICDTIAAENKFRLFDTRMTDSEGNLALFSNPYHFVPAILGGFFLTMATHGTDQSMIQRLLTCKDSFRGKLSMVLSGFLGIGVTVIFLLVGMLLFVYVTTRPEGDAMLTVAEQLKQSGQNGDFYLHYILQGLPPGISGIIIAAVLAAAMSSIDSELNSMSATFVNDFYKPYFSPDASTAPLMKISKIATIVAGLLLIGLAILIVDFYLKNPKTDLLSIALGVMTLFYGALLGVFLVGILTRTRGNSVFNIIAMCFSTAIIIFINYKSRIITALGFDPQSTTDGFASWLYHLKLGWPWFIMIGTGLTFAIAVAGMTTKTIVDSYRQTKDALETR